MPRGRRRAFFEDRFDRWLRDDFTYACEATCVHVPRGKLKHTERRTRESPPLGTEGAPTRNAALSLINARPAQVPVHWRRLP